MVYNFLDHFVPYCPPLKSKSNVVVFDVGKISWTSELKKYNIINIQFINFQRQPHLSYGNVSGTNRSANFTDIKLKSDAVVARIIHNTH